jgi:hypothetical protein
MPFGTSSRAHPVVRTAPTSAAGEPTSVTGVETRSPGEPGSVASAAPRRLPDDGAVPTRLPAEASSVAGVPDPVARRSGPRCRSGALGGRSPGSVGPLDAVHADPVARALALAPPESPPHRAVGVLGPQSARYLDPRGLRLPGGWVRRSVWLLAPSGAALASWTRPVVALLDPKIGLDRPGFPVPVGVRSPVRVTTFADEKPQVKGYF